MKKQIATFGRKSRSILVAHKKRSIIIGIILLVVIVSIISQAFTAKPKHTLAAAKYSKIVEQVSESGKISASGVAPVYSTTTGLVDEVMVQNGTVVERGDVLFHVTSTATQRERETALSNYMAAKSALDAARAGQLSLQASMFGKWDTFKELAESDEYENSDGTPKYVQRAVPEFHIPEKEWLAAEAEYKNQEAVISQKSVEVSALWRAYEAAMDSNVVAVIGGTVRNLAVSRGEQVTAGSSAAAATSVPTLYLVDTTVPTTVKLAVSENEITKIKPGQRATVELDAVAGQTFQATVDRVDSVATPSQDNSEYSVYLTLTKPSNAIRHGMSADVDITVIEKDRVLTVPTSAVKPYRGGRAVRVLDKKGEMVFVPVVIGARGSGNTEIVSGIKEGTMVVTALSNDQIERKSGLF